MALNFNDLTTKENARGINSSAARSNIPEGYAEDLLNVDTDASGQLKKRKGYEGYYGWVPLRVEQVTHSGTDIRLTFDDSQSIDLNSAGVGPIIVSGTIPSDVGATGDFSETLNTVYYSSYDIDNKDLLSAPSGTLSKTASQTGISTSYVIAGLGETTGGSGNSHAVTIPDEIRVDTTSYQIDIDYTVSSSLDGYFYYATKTATAGSVYIATGVAASTVDASVASDITDDSGIKFNDTAHGFVTAQKVQLTTTGTLPTGLSLATDYYIIRVDADNYKFATSVANAQGGTAISWTDDGSGIHTVSPFSIRVDASTHNLSTFNIGVKVFDTAVNSGKATEVIPDLITIDTAGEVVIDMSAALTGYAILTNTGTTNVTEAAPNVGSNSITISSPPAEFMFYYIYAWNGTLWESVIPNDITYDASTDEVTIDYTISGSAETVEIYYEEASTLSNTIKVTDSGAVSETYTETEPQLTVWGIDHANIYKADSGDTRGGHVTHLDNYKAVAEERLVCGLGGNLFSAQGRSEGSNATDYLMPSAYMNARERINGTVIIAPLFYSSAPAAAVTRSRGVVVDTSIDSDHKALVTTAAYVSSGVVNYTLTFDGKTGDVDATAIDVNYDKLTVSGMANDAHNGSFKILSIVSNSSTEVVLQCSNSSIVDDTKDEASALGRAGVFTGKLTLENAPPFIVGDGFSSTAFPSLSSNVVGLNSTVVYIDGIDSEYEFPDGLRVFASRTSDVVPLRLVDGTATTDNYVRGDILAVSTINNKVRVLGANTLADQSISITSTGSVATGTVASTTGLNVGDKVFIYGTTSYDGSVTIASIPTSTTFTWASTETTSESGTLLGKTIYIDESIAIADSATGQTFSVDGRWLPIEAPSNSDNLPKETYIHHFDTNDYDSQTPIRSVMVSDNMYLTNQDDEVMKFDGTNIYRAAFPRWQPSLFAQFDTTTSSLIKGYTVAYSDASSAGYSFTIASPVFQPGNRVYDDTDANIYTVVEVREKDVWNATNTVNDTLYEVVVTGEGVADITNSQTGNLTLVKTYKYYARLNMIDANNNIIASATTGHNDCIIEQVADGQVHLKLVGLPCFDNYDYDRIELELYRTKANTEAPFYLVDRQILSFDNADGYVEIDDGTIDDLLVDLDVVNSALLGTEIGTSWKQPMRGKYITSIDNRLALANLKAYPKLDITIQPTGSTLSAANLNGLTFLFKKDNTDTGTSTDMLNRAKYEFVNSGAVTITPNTDIDNASDASYFDVTSTGHNLNAGEWVYFYHNAAGTNNDLKFAGWWQIASTPDANTLRFDSNLGTDAATAADVDRYVCASTETDIPVWLGTDGNYNWKDGNLSGSVEYIAALRLSNAINCTMRMKDSTISGDEDFAAWMFAGGGNDFNLGQCVVEFPKLLSTTPELVIGTIPSTARVFVNDVLRASSEEVSALTRLFPSRVILSYPNYAEVFDRPDGDASLSDSAVDINAADGQQITGIIPFFGESTFGGAQLNQILVVFKTNSIYLLNSLTREYVKVDSRGLGCTAPYSIAPTRNGIMFANESGIYRLNRDMSVSYVGEMMKGKWRDSVNKNSLAECYGHQYSTGRQYKLSVPISTNTYASEVYVYDHDREGQGQMWGAWTRYDSHPATGWCNQGDDAFYASQDGDVFIIRNRGESTDYRDDASAITSTITLRPEDFGLSGVRKVIRAVTPNLEYNTITSLTLSAAVNLGSTFESAGSVTSTSDEEVSLRASLPTRKLTHLQMKLNHATIDESFTLAGMSYTVGRLDVRGVLQVGDRS